VQAAAGLKARSCLIDGKAVCCDEKGIAVFALLRYRERPAEILLYAFDLLELDGQLFANSKLAHRARRAVCGIIRSRWRQSNRPAHVPC
jgi:ATP-dependent DNA ligase